jgi:hypothetical protein
MKILAERVSYKKDGQTLSKPSEGYEQHILTDLSEYVEVGELGGPLGWSGETYPKGAPTVNHVKVGDKLFKRKPG